MGWLDCNDVIIGRSTCRDAGLLAEQVHLVTGLIFINRDQGLDKIILCQALSTRVDPHKNICYIFLSGIVADFQCRK